MFLGILVLGVFFLCIYTGSTKYFSLDETDIAIRAHMINTEGLKGPIKELGDYEGIAHPPLYEITVAAIFKIFGQREVPVRLFGVLCFILIGVFMGLTLKRLLPPENILLKKLILFFYFIFLFSNPLLVQHSMLVDADTTWIALCVAAFVFVFIRFEDSDKRQFFRSRFLLAVIAALAFLSKEIAPTMMFVAVVFYRVFNRQWKKLGLDFILVIVLSSVIAWTVWGIFCYVSGTNFWIILIRLTAKKNLRVLSLPILLNLIHSTPRVIRWPIFWCSPWFFILLIYCVLWRVRCFFKERHLLPADFVLLAGIFIWTPYFYFKPSMDMMKYQYPAYPFFLLTMSYALFFTLEKMKKIHKTFIALGVLSLVVTALYYYRLGDYLTGLFDFSWGPAWKGLLIGYGAPVVLVIFVLGFLAVIQKKHFNIIFCLTGLLFMFSTNIALGINQLQAKYTTAESWINYGETGLKDTIHYLLKNVSGRDMVSVRKDIRYYLNHRFNIKPLPNAPLESFLPIKGDDVFETTIQSSPLKYIVVDTVSLSYLPVYPGRVQMLEKYYNLDQRFGGFLIYKSKRYPKTP